MVHTQAAPHQHRQLEPVGLGYPDLTATCPGVSVRISHSQLLSLQHPWPSRVPPVADAHEVRSPLQPHADILVGGGGIISQAIIALVENAIQASAGVLSRARAESVPARHQVPSAATPVFMLVEPREPLLQKPFPPLPDNFTPCVEPHGDLVVAKSLGRVILGRGCTQPEDDASGVLGYSVVFGLTRFGDGTTRRSSPPGRSVPETHAPRGSSAGDAGWSWPGVTKQKAQSPGST